MDLTAADSNEAIFKLIGQENPTIGMLISDASAAGTMTIRAMP